MGAERAGLAVLLWAAFGFGCAGERVHLPRRDVIALRASCCRAGLQQAQREVVVALKERARLRLIVAATPAPLAQEPSPDPVRRSFERAKALYRELRLDQAKAAFEGILKRLSGAPLTGLNQEFAETHLYLAAVHYAEQRAAEMAAHCAAAVRYRPTLAVDRDLFSPPVQLCIRAALRTMRKRTVKVVTTPPGAVVYWDGVSAGQTPAVLKGVGEGVHTLAIRHPLYRRWLRQIHVMADAELPATLELLPSAELAVALAAHPALQSVAVRALGVDALVVLSEGEADTLVVAGATRTRHSAVRVSRLTPPAGVRDWFAKLLPPKTAPSEHSRARGTWVYWAIGAAGAALVAGTAAAVAVASSGDSDTARPFRLPLPR